MEFFECKDGASAEKMDKTLRKQQENKKVTPRPLLLLPVTVAITPSLSR